MHIYEIRMALTDIRLFKREDDRLPLRKQIIIDNTFRTVCLLDLLE
jgi:hypothetical protein